MNGRPHRCRLPVAAIVLAACALVAGTWLHPACAEAPAAAKAKVFRAGAYAQDITPDWFPVVVNGGFKPRYAEKALDPLHARCLVLDDGAADRINIGDVLELPDVRDTIRSGKVTVRNTTQGYEFTAGHNLSERQIEVLLEGGQLNYVKARAT